MKRDDEALMTGPKNEDIILSAMPEKREKPYKKGERRGEREKRRRGEK